MSVLWTCSRCLARSARLVGGRRNVRWQSNSSIGNGITNEEVYPALLERARNIAKEHGILAERLNDGFDTQIAKKVGELASIKDALRDWEKAKESLAELQSLLRDPKSDPELRELATEDLQPTIDQLHVASASLTKALIPKHPFADLPCLIEIRPGAGGSEAALFAGDLVRMYQAYCSDQGFRTSLVKYEASETDAVTEAIMEVETPGAYGTLRCEAGVHRVQRVPATEKQGRIHTSSAAVMVLPSIPANDESGEMNFDDPESDYYVDPKDVRIEVMRAQGAGGQHVNKTESAVRLTHVPTNTVVGVQESRSQIKNREKAWSVLRSRLAQAKRDAREEEMVKLRRGVIGVARIGRGDKIRTYNWPQQRITDHRSGVSVHGIEGVMGGGGNLEELMASVRKWLTERDVEDLITAEKVS